MKNLTNTIQIFIFFFIINFSSEAQNSRVNTTQSIEIEKIIEIKKELNKNKSMLRIQI